MPSACSRRRRSVSSLHEPVWFFSDFSSEWAESQCCLCMPGIVHSDPINAIASRDFNLFLSKTKPPPSTSTLKGPACIFQPRERGDVAVEVDPNPGCNQSDPPRLRSHCAASDPRRKGSRCSPQRLADTQRQQQLNQGASNPVCAEGSASIQI